MNPVFRGAAEMAQGGWLMGVMTAVFFFFFLAWAFYAYRPANRDLMDEASRMPFDDGGDA